MTLDASETRRVLEVGGRRVRAEVLRRPQAGGPPTLGAPASPSSRTLGELLHSNITGLRLSYL